VSAAGVLARWKLIGLAVIAIVAIAFLWLLFQPFHSSGSGKVSVTVPKGAGVSEVGDILEKDGVVSSSFFFQLRARLSGDTLLSGSFPMKKDMSYDDAINVLSHTPAPPPTTSAGVPKCPRSANSCTITVPEGYSRAQIAPLAKAARVKGSYVAASKSSPFLKPSTYGAKGATSLEGFLFPDTYDVKSGAPAADLIQLQLQDFKRRIKGVNMKYAKSKNLTTYDVLTIASMIDREVEVPKERKLVAAVIYNRLHQGIPLGIDATIRFATGNYTQPLTESQLATASPYNTRINDGLPPGPIGNPGLASIEAAAHPANVDYLYYVVKPGTCGEHSFSSTNAQFQQDVQRYNSARDAAGGKSPTSC